MRIAITLMHEGHQIQHFAIEVDKPPKIKRIGVWGWWFVPEEEERHEKPYPVDRSWIYVKEED